MRKLTLQFLKSYLNSKEIIKEPLAHAIWEFLKELPKAIINIHDFKNPVVTQKNGLDVGLNIRQGIEQGNRAIEKYNLLENIRLDSVSVDGYDIKCSGPKGRKQIDENSLNES